MLACLSLPIPFVLPAGVCVAVAGLDSQLSVAPMPFSLGVIL